MAWLGRGSPPLVVVGTSGAYTYIYIYIIMLKGKVMGFELATRRSGLNMFFKEWQIIILNYLWSVQPNGTTSAMVWNHLKNFMSEPMSRASVINFLKNMTERGVLRENIELGKGGCHGVYYLNFSESEFKQQIVELFVRKLMEEYPEETKKAVIGVRLHNKA
jgi:hypothetical protein